LKARLIHRPIGVDSFRPSFQARPFDPGISIRERNSHCEMKRIFSSAAALFLCLTFATAIASAQPAGRAFIYSTAPKLNTATLKTAAAQSAQKDAIEIRATATFAFLLANEDDTVAGTLTLTIPESARQKIARVAGKPLNSIPASIAKKEMVAGFRRGTSCPTIQLELGETEIEIAGVKAEFKRILLPIAETSDPIPQTFCAWTRQINAGRARRGIIAALNRLIAPEPAEPK
jgi:hypothetical protein